MQPKPEPKLSRDIGVGRLPCTKWTHTHTLLRGCFQWPPSQIAVPSSSDQNLNAPWRCLGLLLASHQNIRRLGKETEHKSQATFLPNAAWPKGSLSEFRANLGLQTSGFCFALQPGDATYDHDQGCDYDEVIACNMYFAVPVLLIHFYMQYIYIYFRYHHASSNHISCAWFLSGLCYITCHFFYLVFVMIYACVCKYFIVDKRLMFFFLQLPARLQMRDSKTR